MATAKKLLVDLDEVPMDEPWPLDCALSSAWFDAALAKSEGSAYCDGKLAGELLQQGDGRVLLRGSLDARFRVPCARCLADAEIDAGGELVLTFVPRGREFGADFQYNGGHAGGRRSKRGSGDESGEDAGLELTAASLDELTYEPPKLDLAPMVREQLLLSIPMKALCERQEACRGLCGRCGNELNALEPDTANCPKCGLALVEGAADLGDDEEAAESPWKAALRKIGADDED